MDANERTRLYRELIDIERGTRMSVAGKDRFILLSSLIPRLTGSPLTILDVGGTVTTATWLKRRFPAATVTVLNASAPELAGMPGAVRGDAQRFRLGKKYDLVFAGELIEHLYNPDGFLASVRHAVSPSGRIVITTPNLACLANRLFMLMGWTPGNYSASLRYITGNPMLALGTPKFGMIGDHKSVFTWNGLRELLAIHGFTVTGAYGYAYAQREIFTGANGLTFRLSHARLRQVLDAVTPHALREGMLVVAKPDGGKPPFSVSSMTLSKSFWE